MTAVLLWYLTAAPYFLLDIDTVFNISYDELPDALKIAFCFLPNTAISFGILIITRWERMNLGLNLTTACQSVSIYDNLTIIMIIGIFFGEAFLLFLITVCVESMLPGKYSVAKPWYSIFTKNYWAKPINQNQQAASRKLNSNAMDIEDVPLNLPIGIKVQNLTKTFASGEVAVRNLSLNIYQNQITCMLGQNGSGKTSTILMLTGMMQPTSGTAFIDGYNIGTDMDLIRKSMGFCPQHNILFEYLTVKEHILFYSYLRGLNKEAAEREVQKYVPTLNLQGKMNELASTLSGGMKRILSAVIALCGHTTVVLLDEPTSGMDPSTRQAFWNILLAEKTDRTILLTTHYMDEADAFSDRIVILANGSLQCDGSSFNLKQRFEPGYYLTMEKNNGCDSNAVTKQLQSFFAHLQIESETTKSLSYILPAEKAHLFKRMFLELEKNASRLKLRSYGVTSSSIKDVFSNVVTPQSTGAPSQKPLSFYNAANTSTDDRQHLLLRGPALLFSQSVALFKKRFLCSLRTWRSLCCYKLIVILLMMIVVFQSAISSYIKVQPNSELYPSLDSYKLPILIANNDSQGSQLSSDYYESYVKTLENVSASVWDIDGLPDFFNYAVNVSEKLPREYRFQLIGGCSFTKDYRRIRYNPQALHTAPLAFDLLADAVIKSRICQNCSVRTINKPFKYMPSTASTNASIKKYGFTLAIIIGIVIGIVSASYISFYIQERSSKSKFLQYVCGANLHIFWIISILWDLLMISITISLIILIVALGQNPNWSTSYELSMVFAILLAFHFCIIPVYAILSSLFTDPGMGVYIASLANITIGKDV